jgi:hypothetical protein
VLGDFEVEFDRREHHPHTNDGATRRPLRVLRARADDGFVSELRLSRSAHVAVCRIPLLAPAARRGIISAALLLALLLSLLALPAPATAIVVKVGSAEVGAQPRNTEFVLDGQLGASFANDSGNPVIHGSSIYSVFWDPTNSYHGDWQHLIDEFLHNMGGVGGLLDNVFAVDEQYTDRSNQPAANTTVFKGAYTDTNAYPSSGCTDPHPFEEVDQLLINKVHTPVCVTDEQVQTELKKFLIQHKLPTGMSTIYYVLTPPGVTVCLDAGGGSGHCSDFTGSSGGTSYKNSFCSYHGAINPGGLTTGDANTILYATIPWSAGGLGDLHLIGADRRQGYDCQDGGFDPSSKPIEQAEHPAEKSAKEIEEFEEATPKEKEEKEEAEALQGPHEQQPNQVGCPSKDGGCDTGLADVIIGQIALEQQNVTTNPLLNGWQDASHNEVTDECRNFFAPVLGGSSGANAESFAGTLYNQTLDAGSYYLQTAFNLAAFTFSYPGVPCIPGVELEPQFTSPNPVNAGELVGFDGMESTITLNAGVKYPAAGSPSATYPTYTWDFGDGSPTVSGFAPGAPSQNSPETSPCEAPWLPPCAAAAFHTYQYGGSYEVTLTVKDVGGNTESITKPVTVNGPLPPAPPPTPETAKTDTGSGGGSSNPETTTSDKGAGSTQPNLLATQAVSSHSLASVLRSGLVVRYSVNAGAAGRFEVLLARSIAKKIGLHGPAATGLAKGTPAQIVVAKAILVTTKAGHSSYRIKFSKATAAKLRKLHRVSLMIRLVVHNASSPVAKTVLSTANLAH